MRKRITIDEWLYKAAVEYASFDHRTFSELVSESLKQIMKRYPKGEKEEDTKFLVDLRSLKIEVTAISADVNSIKTWISKERN